MPGPRDSTTPGFTLLGAVTGHHGIRGWVRVRSFTRPAEEILQYHHWTLLPAAARGRFGRAGKDATQGGLPPRWRVAESRQQSNGLIVRLEGVSSREDAEPMIGCQIAIADGELPKLPDGEYYWAELIGLTVINRAGRRLGIVDHLLETGANDVLVVRDPVDADPSERLIPWGRDIIDKVDTVAGELHVDWESDD